MPTILDFQIQPLSAESYSLTVCERGVVQSLASTTFSHRVDFLTDFSVDRLNASAKDAAERFDELQKFGRELYQKLFPPAIEQVWREYKQRSEFLILCLRFAEGATKLEALPWETLHDGEEFIAAGAKTTLTRLPLDVAPPDELPPIPRPLKLFGFFASPLDLQDHERLNAEREQEILLEAIDDPAAQGRISADFEDEAKLEILERSLQDGCHILHFTGHGISPRDGGGLLLEDAHGKKLPASIADVMQAVESGVGKLRLAVISGCQTARTLHTGAFNDLARGLLLRRVPAVIAMQFSITDEGGLKFAEVFYREIAKGVELERGVHAARRALLEDKQFFINNDALAIVLLAADGACLQTTEAESLPPQAEPGATYLGDRLDPLAHCFYGRRREYRKIRDALLHQDQRAVIIHGIGGIGKTALLTHAINRLRPRFKDVMSFDCRRAALAPETILLELHRYFATRGMPQLQSLIGQNALPETLAEEIAKLLIEWPLLIVFDNFESQLDERRAFLNEDLRVFLKTLMQATATGSRFLFTTRYLFDLDGERTGNLQELPLGDLSRPEALMLMQKLPNLAQAAHRDKLAVMEKFGGHPYTLVTLDRYCSHQPLDQVLRDAGLVQSELREFLAIELTYQRLSDQARELLNRFAAFRQAVPLGAARWVIGEQVPFDECDLRKLAPDEIPEEWKTLDKEALIEMLNRHLPERRQSANLDCLLQELIDWGLLTSAYQDDKPNSLTMHALVRKFCCDQQHSETWRARLRDAASFYTNLTKLLEQNDKSQEAVWGEMEAFALLIEAEDFFNAAELLVRAHKLLSRWGFGHYLENQYHYLLGKLDGREAAIILHNFGLLSMNRGNYDESLDHHQRSLKIVEELSDVAEVACSLHQIGNLYYIRGNYDAALDHYQRSLKILEELGDTATAASSLHQIGMLYQARGNYDAALEHYERSLKILKEVGDEAAVANSLHQIGMLYKDRGNYDAALEHYQRSLKIAEKLGDMAGVASSLNQIGMLQQFRGNHDEALGHYHRSLKSLEDLGDVFGMARSLHQIANLHYLHGDYDTALDYYQRSLKIKERLGDKAGVASSLHQIGMMHQDRGNHDAAFDHYQRSLKIAEEIGEKASVALSLHQAGTLHQERGNYDEALDHYQRSIKIDEELGNVAGVARSFHQIGILYHLRGNNDAALDHYQRSLKIDEELGDAAGVAVSLHQIGMLYQDCGGYNESLDYYQRSLRIAENLGDMDGVASSLHQIGTLYQDSGDYDEALSYYQRSLGIAEELGDLAGIASSKGQIGKLMVELGQYWQATPLLVSALSIFSELQSPNTDIVTGILRELRSKWGEQEFDAAWQEALGKGVAEWLKDKSEDKA